jgi:hypothetical protein
VGRYEVNPKATFTVTREGNKLMGQYAGEEKFELLPASRSNFFSAGDTAVYAFCGTKQGTWLATYIALKERRSNTKKGEARRSFRKALPGLLDVNA